MDIVVPEAATAIAVLLHPHPAMGGDRFNHVVSTLFARLPRQGIGAVRFDFTSADLDQAVAEATASIDAVEEWSLPIVLVGYSFGALVAAHIADPRIRGWFLVALPADRVPDAALRADPRPKGLALPEHDVSSPARVIELTADWAATETHVIAGADHSLGGHAPAVADLAAGWILRLKANESG
jgi:alpha/beta superfamily hydrolase